MGEENETLLAQPYLGPGGEFQERTPGMYPALSRICMLGAAASLSVGPLFGGLNGVKFVLERSVDETCRALMMETLGTFYARFEMGLNAEKPTGAMGSTD